jgi:transcriptional regulator with XRE-family HTH domain
MIGDRIKLARGRKGFSLRALSTEMKGKVTAQAIGKYERGEAYPGSDVLLSLSKALSVSMPYLVDGNDPKIKSIEFISKVSSKTKIKLQVELIEWLDRYLQIEQILDFSLIFNLGSLDLDIGEQPIKNIAEYVESYGIKIYPCYSLEPVHYSNFRMGVYATALTNSMQIPIIGVNLFQGKEQQRFSIAYQLAVLSGLEKPKEFARALLIPESHVKNIIGEKRTALSEQEIIYAKLFYGVPAAELLYRLKDLGIISSSVLTYVFQDFARGWRTDEPTPCGGYERSDRFFRLCYRALSEGLISEAKLQELLKF